MNTRQLGILGMAVLGLALSVPVQAAPDFGASAFIVAKSDWEGEGFRADERDARRDARKDERAEGQKRRPPKREAEAEEPQGYGYGYERRQQRQDDDRPRGHR